MNNAAENDILCLVSSDKKTILHFGKAVETPDDIMLLLRDLVMMFTGNKLDGVRATVETMDADLYTRLAEEIEHMPPNTRAVLVLHYFEGLSIRQLADVLGIKTGTAKSRLAYGLARLRTPTLKEIAG